MDHWEEKTEKRLLCILSAILSGQYDSVGSGTEVITESDVREDVLQFSQFLVNRYGRLCLNRRQSSMEMLEIEKKYNRKGLRGCVGFHDILKIEENEYKEGGNRRNCAVEVWTD